MATAPPICNRGDDDDCGGGDGDGDGEGDAARDAGGDAIAYACVCMCDSGGARRACVAAKRCDHVTSNNVSLTCVNGVAY
jgi:hypothetical protein